MSCGPKSCEPMFCGPMSCDPKFGGLINSGPKSSDLAPMSGGPKSGDPKGPSTVYGAACNSKRCLLCLGCTYL